MATVKYLIKGKTELSTIFVRLLDGRKTDITVSTGYIINPDWFDNKKQIVKQIAENQEKINLSNKLTNLQRKIADSFNSDKGNGKEINKDWLDLVIAKVKNPKLEEKTEYLIDFIELYKKELEIKINHKTGKRISPLTVKNFNTTMMRLKKFEAFKKKKFLISEVDLMFHTQYNQFATKKLLLSINSISKDISQIKTVCLDARDKDYLINKQVETRKFNSPSEKTLFVTITESELERIKNFKGADYLQNSRDWLIIGCWTGCRVGDLMQLDKSNLQISVKGQKFIRYTQSKTGKQVDIPIHKDVENIIERLGGFPRPISDQRFNDWIKIVCQKSGMIELVHGTRQNPKTHLKETGTFEKWQLIRSHTCRRSFATNHYNKLSNKLIMAVTGHGTEKMLIQYLGETENDHLDDFLSAWDITSNEKSNIIELNKKSV